MKRSLQLICLLLCLKTVAQPPITFITDADHLEKVKKKAAEKDNATLQLISSLQKQADAVLDIKPMSVMDKTFTPVSGNKHDYMSQAPYFWYDSTKPNGLPYLRKDGERNPEIYKITDRTYLGKLEEASRILSLTWYFTGEEKYAAKAASLLRTWFLDEATKMNPNLDYGQAIPGVNTGRGIGIIESVALMGIADAAGILVRSASWKASDHKLLQQWYEAYLKWMLSSKNGGEEHQAKNNHGTWYYAQVIDFALFTNNTATAKQLAEESKKRLDGQLTKEGQQPLELERTNALGYSTMNLRGWFTVATLANKTGIDIWNYQTTQSATVHTAFDWLLPYAMGKKNWTYQQISKYNTNDLYPLLLQAATVYKEQQYLDAAKELKKENMNVMNDLLFAK
jgi:hypothetical protein